MHTSRRILTPTVVFICLSLFASGLNYLVYPLISRILPSAEYVNTTVALSLLTQIGTFMSAILAINIGLAKEVESKKESENIAHLLNAKISVIFLGLAALLIITAPFVMTRIGTPVLYAIPIALMMVASVPIAIVSGFLNGRQRMLQLGLVTLFSASAQFTLALLLAAITRNGLYTLLGMGISQVIAITLIYIVLKKEKLPPITSLMFRHIPSLDTKQSVRKILAYTIVASFAVMVLNLLQVADLLLIKNRFPTDAHSYTDVYVISRIAFFAGTIFMWPLLGKLQANSSRANIRYLAKFTGIILLISLSLLAGVALIGPWLFGVLFGSIYESSALLALAAPSILYKTPLILVTAMLLYFITIREWHILAITIVAGVAALVGLTFTSAHTLAATLTIIAALSLFVAIVTGVMFIYHNNPRHASK